ncbi:MAG TPA: cyclic nucleotide-binding domain-containing protein [bacterium]|nr:cyclic nucleotide-binding domain-containing protein [bacterium]HPN30341.1 cyclic nucleotide-binding domain-containing protein [bacterium]
MDINLIKKNEIFNLLTDEELKLIETICKTKKMDESESIFEEGDESDALYILMKGRVAIEIQLQMKSDKASVHTVEEGQVFGEFALIDKAPRSASAIAVKESTLLEISINDLNKLMDSNSNIGYKIMKNFNKILSTRIKKTTKELRASLLWN